VFDFKTAGMWGRASALPPSFVSASSDPRFRPRRSIQPIFSTRILENPWTSVEKSLDAARTSACATLAAGFSVPVRGAKVIGDAG
jgi:hypothetical protein